MSSGTLYVVATPIGNLGDISRRAVATLAGVSMIAAEDTRRTRQLLTALELSVPLTSFHAHSPPGRLRELLDRLLAGESIALVTDAGTPGISDPGPQLVNAAREAGVTVVPIPGPTAVATAIAASGLPADRHLFLGFPPRKGRERNEWLDVLAGAPWTVICFEAANRLVPLLNDLAAVCGGTREAVVARELTKLHEEFRSGTLAELAAWYDATPPRGEVTLLVAGASREELSVSGPDEATIQRLVAEGRSSGLSDRELVRHLTRAAGISRNEAYRLVMELKG